MRRWLAQSLFCFGDASLWKEGENIVLSRRTQPVGIMLPDVFEQRGLACAAKLSDEFHAGRERGPSNRLSLSDGFSNSRLNDVSLRLEGKR
jgi:hypothetical protein